MGKRIFVVALIAVVLAAALLWGTGAVERYIYKLDFEEYVETYSGQNGLPQSLVYAVIYTESRFNKDAVSKVGASGLMQIMPDTFEWIKYRMRDKSDIAYSDMLDPELNIKYGTFLLKLLISDFGSYENALAAYHAGSTRVEGWLQNGDYSHDGKTLHTIPFRDTDHYVRKVLDAMHKYQTLYDLD